MMHNDNRCSMILRMISIDDDDGDDHDDGVDDVNVDDDEW